MSQVRINLWFHGTSGDGCVTGAPCTHCSPASSYCRRQEWRRAPLPLCTETLDCKKVLLTGASSDQSFCNGRYTRRSGHASGPSLYRKPHPDRQNVSVYVYWGAAHGGGWFCDNNTDPDGYFHGIIPSPAEQEVTSDDALWMLPSALKQWIRSPTKVECVSPGMPLSLCALVAAAMGCVTCRRFVLWGKFVSVYCGGQGCWARLHCILGRS